MPQRPLTASDRKSLIRLATELPKGSDERRAILAGLKVSWFKEPMLRSSMEELLDVEDRLISWRDDIEEGSSNSSWQQANNAAKLVRKAVELIARLKR
jgi:hypothetical protein